MDHYHRLDAHANVAVMDLVPYGESAGDREALFSRLDGQWVRGREGTWQTAVVSIVAERDVTWVQVAPADAPSTSVVLRLVDVRRVDLALEALRTWSSLPEDRRPTWIHVGLPA